jgi:hypothetical protein
LFLVDMLAPGYGNVEVGGACCSKM